MSFWLEDVIAVDILLLTSSGGNIVVAKKSYQMLSFKDRERALPPSTEISELTFEVKKVQ